MKRIQCIPAIVLFMASAFSYVQVKPPVKKIHGYKQSSLPGIQPDYSETGRKPKQNYNYWFYLELPKTEKITMKGLWISGIAHDFKSETIEQLPVRKITFTGLEKNDTTIMVPVTKYKVILIYPSGESTGTVSKSKYISSVVSKNELVISYTWKNKTWYFTLKKLKELNPDVRS